jgi:thiol-disulfide isomerase/thioredoxin
MACFMFIGIWAILPRFGMAKASGVIMEYYFSVGCPSCQRMSGYLKDFKMEGVRIYGYAVGASDEAAKAYAEEAGLPFPVKTVPREDVLFILAYPTIVLKNSEQTRADFIEGVIEPYKLKAKIEAFINGAKEDHGP